MRFGMPGFASRLICSALTLSSLAAIPASLADARALESEEPDADHFTVWCKIWVSEDGIARTVEVLKVEPHTRSDAAVGASVKQAVLTWKFTPKTKDGKPLAGYVTVPVEVN